MTRNIKIPKVHKCTVERCQFVTPTRTELRKHYQIAHDLKETVKASLIETGWEYRFE